MGFASDDTLRLRAVEGLGYITLVWDLFFFAFLGGYEWVLDSHLINNAAFVVLSMAHWLCRQQSRY